MPERTLADLFEEMKHGNIGNYIRSGAEMPEKYTDSDADFIRQSGFEVHKLHGCTECNEHVWHEKDDGDHCPKVGCNGRRYDEDVGIVCMCAYHILSQCMFQTQ